MAEQIKLLTIADGFGDTVVSPTWYPNYFKWPEIIKLMTKNISLINLSRYGAGNEYIVNCVQQNANSCNIALIQWAVPNRLDLLLAHKEPHLSDWYNLINHDSVYNNNILEIDNNKFWLSSGSTNQWVKEYHSKFISLKQHQNRSQIYIDYAMLLFQSKNVNYKFLLTSKSHYLSEYVKMDPWVWHSPWEGMNEFRHLSKYVDLELGLDQPIPLVAFEFIKNYIVSAVDLPWRSAQEIDAVENMLYRKYQEAIKNKPND
jgi:hypothetical protein